MIYRLKDIAKLLKLPFKSKLNFKLPKSEILQFHKKVEVSANPGISYLSKSDIRFGRYEFPKFGYFSEKRITGFRESSPELVAGVGEEGRRSCGRSSLTSSRRRTAKRTTR